MARPSAMTSGVVTSIDLGGRTVEYRVIHSRSAQKLRVRVGLDGVKVVQPQRRESSDISSFLLANAEWITSQLKRIEDLRSIRRPHLSYGGQILYRGEPTPVQVEDIGRRQGTNQVVFQGGSIVIVRGRASNTLPERTLERWLRKQARMEITRHVDVVTRRIQRYPKKVYIMDQRTKWGNCSTLQNLSFNWRLIMGPDFVLQYLVTHEVVHLAVPDHSKKFWLTVQSICPQMEEAKQWLSRYGHQLLLEQDLFTLE